MLNHLSNSFLSTYLLSLYQKPKAPAGWLAELGKKLVMNVMVKIENLTVQYEEEGGIVASAYICNVLLHSADPAAADWSPAYNECDPQTSPWLFKALHLDDVSICLDEREFFLSVYHHLVSSCLFVTHIHFFS